MKNEEWFENEDPMQVAQVIRALTEKIDLLKEQRDLLDKRVVELNEACDAKAAYISKLEKENLSLIAQVEQLTFRNKHLHDESSGERLKVGKLEEHLRASEERSKYWQKLAIERAAENEDLRYSLRTIRDSVLGHTKKV